MIYSETFLDFVFTPGFGIIYSAWMQGHWSNDSHWYELYIEKRYEQTIYLSFFYNKSLAVHSQDLNKLEEYLWAILFEKSLNTHLTEHKTDPGK